jgi:hypothetical protein
MSRCIGLTDDVGRRGGQQWSTQQQRERTKKPRTTFLKTGSGKSAYFTSCSPNLARRLGNHHEFALGVRVVK